MTSPNLLRSYTGRNVQLITVGNIIYMARLMSSASHQCREKYDCYSLISHTDIPEDQIPTHKSSVYRFGGSHDDANPERKTLEFIEGLFKRLNGA